MGKSTKKGGKAGRKSTNGAGGKPGKGNSRNKAAVKKSSKRLTVSKSLKAGSGGRDAQSSYELLKQMSMGWPGDGKSRSTGGNKVENLEWVGPGAGGGQTVTTAKIEVPAVPLTMRDERVALMNELVAEMEKYKEGLRHDDGGVWKAIGLGISGCVEIVRVVLGEGKTVFVK